jgi:molybdopterin-containing oxidoreductase family iron-sulfur binding subunit
MAFGRDADAHYRLSEARVIVSLDADFLATDPAGLRYIREFADGRRVWMGREKQGLQDSPHGSNGGFRGTSEGGAGHPAGEEGAGAAAAGSMAGQGMNRLYVVESTFTMTGAKADHRLAVRHGEVERIARSLAAAVGVIGPQGASLSEAVRATGHIASFAADLKKHPGRSAVIAGEPQPPIVHALAHAINLALGNAGKTVFFTDSVEAAPIRQGESLARLVSDMNSGQVEMLLIVGGNPAYDAPADLDFAAAVERVGLRVHLSLYDGETSELCHWHVAEAHPLEAWSDARAFDGTVTILQPLIAPLYEGKSAHEFLAAFSQQPGRSGHDIVREHWMKSHGGTGFEGWWRKTLHDGLAEGSAFPHHDLALRSPAEWLEPLSPRTQPAPGTPQPGASQQRTPGPGTSPLGAPTPSLPPPSTSGPGSSPPAPAERVGRTSLQGDGEDLDLAFRPDPSVHDGEWSNNGWLQELPKPLTRLTWDNAALLAPALAQRQGVENGDVVEITASGRRIEAPVWILPGQPDHTVTIHLGYGRKRAGRVGTGIGFNAYALRTSDSPWVLSGARLSKTGRRVKLASTQVHHSMEGRHLVRSASLEHHNAHPHWVHEVGGHEPDASMTMYPAYEYKGNAWGMAIDLTACVGCNACVIACQAENNIPVVGKSQVALGREMHWIRVDRYFEGSPEDPRVHNQPVPCMHCEDAPCEVVCPVAATVHNHEGLNDMIYNRCVGTRYCANNCPYKVRRFNFLQYSDQKTASLKLLANPDVTVRTRGVMEKCTYCVQRINQARIEARKEDRPIRDGEIVTACQQACPAQAIVFGDVNDPQSRVSRMKASPLHYGLLTELNTRPRTTYLAEIRNTSATMEGSSE